ncbi:MAG: DVU_1555 family C-GCAxxG-C-C protein [Syntrophorhabdales bacterium]
MLRLRQKGYCCSQIMLIGALEAQRRTNAELIRAVGGLCDGVGMSGEACGSLSGGACLISLYAGKGSEEEEADERLPVMMNEFATWFREVIGEAYGGIRCDDILTRCPDKSVCGSIVAAAYAKAIEILDAHGIDLGRGKDG